MVSRKKVKSSNAPQVAEIFIFQASARCSISRGFTDELAEMYKKFAQRRGWVVTDQPAARNKQDARRVVHFTVKGKDALIILRPETGVHRVCRVPKGETQGRTHVSFVQVEVIEKPFIGNQVVPGETKFPFRTYDFTKGSVQDHRTKTKYPNLTEIMDGNLDELLSSPPPLAA